jgi:GLPGLI family protein
MKKIISLSIALALTCSVTVAQKKISQGKAIFNVEWDSPEMNDQMKSMLPTEAAIYFKNKMTRVEMTMGMMGENVTISDGTKGESISYMNMMGNKMGIKTTKADAEKNKDEKPVITKTDETKMIAGYKCTKSIAETKGSKFDIWFTKDIEAANSSQSAYEGIDGFLMEFSADQNGMTMKMSCKSIEAQTIADDMFKPLDGYEIMTQEEMKAKFGGRK